MKKLYLSYLVVSVFFVFILLPSTHALEFDNKLEFKQIEKRIDQRENYGKYEIYNSLFLGLGKGELLQEYTLLDNDDSILNAYAIIEVINYDSIPLLYDIDFRDIHARNVKYYVEVTEFTNQITPLYNRVCERNINGTNTCIDNNFKNQTNLLSKTYFKEYNGENLPSGRYKLKITGIKNKPNEPLDWILISGSGKKRLQNWAWWDNSWAKKQLIQINTTQIGLQNQSVLINVTYNSNMQTSFNDIRFVDDTETNELGQWKYNNTCITGSSCQFWVNISSLTATSNRTIYMYYNNSGVSSTSDITTAFILGDDWDSVDSSKWNALAGSSSSSWTASGGELQNTITSGSPGNAWFVSKQNFSNFISEARIRLNSNANNVQFYQTANTNPNPSGNSPTDAVGTVTTTARVTTSSTSTDSGGQATTVYMRAILKANETTSGLAEYQTDSGSGVVSRTGVLTGTQRYIGYMRYHDTAATSTAYSDWIYIRGYTEQEPSIGFGAEQSAPIVSSISTTLNSPNNATQTSSTSIVFNASAVTTSINLTNATIRIYNSTTSLFNISNISMDTTTNNILFTIPNFVSGTYYWNILMCGITNNGSTSTLCSTGTSNFTLIIGSSANSYAYNDYTYETSQETFQTNVSIVDGETLSSANLYYNGTSYDTTASLISGNNYSLLSTIDIPSSAIGSNTTQWFHSIITNVGQTNLTAYNQSVGAINLTIYGSSPQNYPYLNITFKNETTALENVGASLSGTFTYWLGTGNVNKTLSFTNSSENYNYSFAFSPQNKTINVITLLTYDNADSQQRSYGQTTTYSNVTTNQVLYLLPNSDGLFSPFVTVDSNGNAISGVTATITRTINSVSTTIGTSTTDSSGFVTFFLNPDFTYTATFTKSGYPTNTFSFTPTTDTRTVVMGTTGGSIVSNGTQISQNTTYQTFPSNSSLLNNTNYTFALNVTSGQSITLITMNITNSSGYQLSYQTNSGAGYISESINTGNYSTLIGYYSISTSSENLTFSRVWFVSNDFIGDYSIYRQLTLYLQYDFQRILQFLIVILVIFGTLMFMGGIEGFDNVEAKIMVVFLMVWTFSYLGWLDTGIINYSTNPSIEEFGQFSNKYGIAILTSGASFFFLARRLFTQ